MRRNLYLVLAILGFILPYAFFIPFLLETGFDFGQFITQLLATRAWAWQLWIYWFRDLPCGCLS